MSRMPGRSARAMFAIGALAVLASACGGGRKENEFRMTTESFTIRVAVDPAPPKAVEQITWTVVVMDKETGRPVDMGEGRIFASSRDGKNISNGFARTDRVGTYTTKLFFVTAGTWAMGIQFRRDSTQVLERTQDWMQDVRSGDEPGEYTLPSVSPVPTDSAKPDSTRPDTSPPEGAAPPR